MSPASTAESQRPAEHHARQANWRKWGPYLSERAWGTVREDYSPHGEAWDYFSHDHARSRAYRWNEDGLGGISDRHQHLCFAIVLWNGRDPILKERLFGLAGQEGNHGEDVKEYYFYLDNTSTHSYMKMLYKYPQAAFPYEQLLDENRRRGRDEDEFELIDTGIFDEDRYFDLLVEYAKAGQDDILIQLTITNRGPEAAALHLLPTLWFRNTWSWGYPAGSKKFLSGTAPDSDPFTAGRAHFRTTFIGGITYSIMNISTPITAPGWALATKRAGRPWFLIFYRKVRDLAREVARYIACRFTTKIVNSEK